MADETTDTTATNEPISPFTISADVPPVADAPASTASTDDQTSTETPAVDAEADVTPSKPKAPRKSRVVGDPTEATTIARCDLQPGASWAGPVLLNIPPDTVVGLTDYENETDAVGHEWQRVTYQGSEGYVQAQNLQPVKPSK